MRNEGKLVDRLDQVCLTSLEGLGASYRMKGYFTLRSEAGALLNISFEGVAFGGNYGGHNVNVNLTDEEKAVIKRQLATTGDEEFDELLSEVQRRLLNNEMNIEYDGIKPRTDDSGIGLP